MADIGTERNKFEDDGIWDW